MGTARSLEESSLIFRELLAAARPGYWWALGGAVLTFLLA